MGEVRIGRGLPVYRQNSGCVPDPSVVAIADGASLLPSVARSLRARGHAVGGYVLIEPVIPAVSDTWPDAPVSVYCSLTSDIARVSELRGWDVCDIAHVPSCRDW